MSKEVPKTPPLEMVPVNTCRFTRPIDLIGKGSSDGVATRENIRVFFVPKYRAIRLEFDRPGTDPQAQDMPWPVQVQYITEHHVVFWTPL